MIRPASARADSAPWTAYDGGQIVRVDVVRQELTRRAYVMYAIVMQPIRTVHRNVMIVELPTGWRINWPEGMSTVAPAASVALKRVMASDKRLTARLSWCVLMTEITWCVHTAVGRAIVRALQ